MIVQYQGKNGIIKVCVIGVQVDGLQSGWSFDLQLCK